MITNDRERREAEQALESGILPPGSIRRLEEDLREYQFADAQRRAKEYAEAAKINPLEPRVKELELEVAGWERQNAVLDEQNEVLQAQVRSLGETLKRFLLKVRTDPEGCWTWIAAVNDASGYGSFSLDGRMIGAHQASYILFNGPIPTEGPNWVLHKCDNKVCVRPDHLYLGDRKQNIEDARNRGIIASGDRNGQRTHPEKTVRGEQHHAAKLTEEQVKEIRTKHAGGRVTFDDLAKEYQVSRTTIVRAVKGLSWREMRGAEEQKAAEKSEE